jgi:hypothetical protein
LTQEGQVNCQRQHYGCAYVKISYVLINWHTRFNCEIIEGLLTNDAMDMPVEPEKMNALTKPYPIGTILL